MTIPCAHCGLIHANICQRIKAIEYYKDGATIKRVEYLTPMDMNQPMVATSAVPSQPETDEDYRKRLIVAMGAGSIHLRETLISSGVELDRIGENYDLKRIGT